MVWILPVCWSTLLVMFLALQTTFFHQRRLRIVFCGLPWVAQVHFYNYSVMVSLDGHNYMQRRGSPVLASCGGLWSGDGMAQSGSSFWAGLFGISSMFVIFGTSLISNHGGRLPMCASFFVFPDPSQGHWTRGVVSWSWVKTRVL